MEKDKSGKAMRATILVVGTLIALAMAYGSGLGQGNRAARKARDARDAAEVKLSMARTEVSARDAILRQLEARRQMHLALLALDDRNFGIAQQHLSGAANLLSTGANASLAGQIKAVSIVAAGDMGQQRQQILDFTRQLDSSLTLPPDLAAPVAPGTAP